MTATVIASLVVLAGACYFAACLVAPTLPLRTIWATETLARFKRALFAATWNMHGTQSAEALIGEVRVVVWSTASPNLGQLEAPCFPELSAETAAQVWRHAARQIAERSLALAESGPAAGWGHGSRTRNGRIGYAKGEMMSRHETNARRTVAKALVAEINKVLDRDSSSDLMTGLNDGRARELALRLCVVLRPSHPSPTSAQRAPRCPRIENGDRCQGPLNPFWYSEYAEPSNLPDDIADDMRLHCISCGGVVKGTARDVLQAWWSCGAYEQSLEQDQT